MFGCVGGLEGHEPLHLFTSRANGIEVTDEAELLSSITMPLCSPFLRSCTVAVSMNSHAD